MHNLRFIKRNGEEVLQQLILVSADQEKDYGRIYNRKYIWVDIPKGAETEYKNRPDPLMGTD